MFLRFKTALRMSIRKPEIIAIDDKLDAERCIVELERGREVTVRSDVDVATATLVETLTKEKLHKISQGGSYQLILTQTRAKVLDLVTSDPAVSINIDSNTSLEQLLALSGLLPMVQADDLSMRVQAVSDIASGALNLVRQAPVLPALVLYAKPILHNDALEVSAKTANSYQTNNGALVRLSNAKIPLSTADQVELTVFKELHGTAEHVAITVGQPDFEKAVTVRLHSSCFTGDILGSLRCDCGEQLQGSISNMAESGGGVVLYVSQEGRGIGLASKLRAYQLQDEGLDTIEANQHLGFEADRRRYPVAVSMLQALGIQKIRLVTNNPTKIDALRLEGIVVVERLPSFATTNVHNQRYLETKRQRAGHLSMESTL